MKTKEINEEKRQKAIEKRMYLKQLSQELRPQQQLLALTDEYVTINELLLEHYRANNGVTELNTFEEWKKKGYAVKRGETSFLVWGKPLATAKAKQIAEETGKPIEEVKKDFFPVCHLFDKTQVHAIKNK